MKDTTRPQYAMANVQHLDEVSRRIDGAADTLMYLGAGAVTGDLGELLWTLARELEQARRHMNAVLT